MTRGNKPDFSVGRPSPGRRVASPAQPGASPAARGAWLLMRAQRVPLLPPPTWTSRFADSEALPIRRHTIIKFTGDENALRSTGHRRTIRCRRNPRRCSDTMGGTSDCVTAHIRRPAFRAVLHLEGFLISLRIVGKCQGQLNCANCMAYLPAGGSVSPDIWFVLFFLSSLERRCLT